MLSVPFRLGSRRARVLGALGALAALALTVSALRAERLPAPEAHFAAGACASCHEGPPKYHAEPNWALDHGRTEQRNVARCGSCHAQRACAECHARAPATHTSAFRSPERRGDAEQLHVYVGRSRPAACLVCHTEPRRECTSCHSADEVERMRARSSADLTRWREHLPALEALTAPTHEETP